MLKESAKTLYQSGPLNQAKRLGTYIGTLMGSDQSKSEKIEQVKTDSYEVAKETVGTNDFVRAADAHDEYSGFEQGVYAFSGASKTFLTVLGVLTAFDKMTGGRFNEPTKYNPDVLPKKSPGPNNVIPKQKVDKVKTPSLKQGEKAVNKAAKQLPKKFSEPKPQYAPEQVSGYGKAVKAKDGSYHNWIGEKAIKEGPLRTKEAIVHENLHIRHSKRGTPMEMQNEGRIRRASRKYVEDLEK